MSERLSSPIHLLGGKARLAERIVAAFPPSDQYDTYLEPFCGSCAVLFAKPPYGHLEAINDRNKRLVNFWMQVRNDAVRLQGTLATLPYSSALFEQYRSILDEDELRTDLEPLEEAALWYYVNRSTIAGHSDPTKGWAYAGPHQRTLYGVPSRARSYRNAVALLSALTERLGDVQIHAWDAAWAIERYASPRTLLYVDPPYFGLEQYYAVDGTPPWTPDDHKRLAALLNATSALVALSYYDGPELEHYYPSARWRRMELVKPKDTSHMNHRHEKAREVLLMNYAPVAPERFPLWEAFEEQRAQGEEVAS